MSNFPNSPLSIAPMIDWTYSHFRFFMRLLAPKALLYTEMQTTGAILNNPIKSLSFHSQEHPIAIQIGGSDPLTLAQCAYRAEQEGYDEVNINLGCPSDKVQAGRFGACLMKEKERVVDCIKAMKSVISIPVTAKTRIGIDYYDSYDFFSDFIHTLVEAGIEKVIIHARKAWLNGLSPKQNRTIPPINYDFVYSLKKELPNIPIVINGGILNINEVTNHLKYVDGVMLGRLACDNPYQIAIIHQALYPQPLGITRSQVFDLYFNYMVEEYNKNQSLSLLVKPLLNFAFSLNGAKQWKNRLMHFMQTKDFKLLEQLRNFLKKIEEGRLAVREG